MKKYFLSVLFTVFLASGIPEGFAQFPMQSRQSQETQKEMEERRKETEKMLKEMEKMQQQQLETLKKNNPEAYNQQKKTLDDQQKISAILSSFQNKSISADVAEKQLYPLLKNSPEFSTETIDSQIAQTEKKLNSLKKIRTNPDIAVKKRIDQMLGKTMPSPEDMMF